MGFSLQRNTIFHCLLSLKKLTGLEILNSILRCMYVISLTFCLKWTKHWKQLVYCLFRTFTSLFHMQENLCPSFQIYVWSTTFQAYLIASIMHSWNKIKNKVASLFDTCKNESGSSCMVSFEPLPIIIMLLSLLEYIVRFLLLSVDDINLVFIARCIFHSNF